MMYLQGGNEEFPDEATSLELRGSRHAVYPAAEVASISALIGPAPGVTSHSVDISAGATVSVTCAVGASDHHSPPAFLFLDAANATSQTNEHHASCFLLIPAGLAILFPGTAGAELRIAPSAALGIDSSDVR
jgi:hypothetical protein